MNFKTKKKQFWLLLLTIATIFFSVFLYIKTPKTVVLVENIIKDYMFILRGDIQKDNRIAIVDIDEKSLSTLGQWPWSRNILAKIIENLTNAGVGIIGLDLILSEEDRSSPSKVFKDLDLGIDIKKKLPNYDDILAETISQAPVVTGFAFEMQGSKVILDKEPMIKAVITERDKPKGFELWKAYKASVTVEKINNSAYSNGFVNYLPTKFDNVVRYVPTVISFDDLLYPSLDMEISRLALGVKKVVIQYNDEGVDSIYLNDKKIPTDLNGNIRINYTGYHPAYPYISASDIYNNTFKKEDVEGKIILIGTSATGLYDLRSSPFDSVMPGVESHAHIIDNILNDNLLAEPRWTVLVNLLSILFIGFLCFLVLLSPKSSVSILAGVLFLSLVFGIHYYFMFEKRIVFHTTILMFEIIFMYLTGNIINYIFESQQKELIKGKFANKVSKEVMEDLVNDLDNSTLKADMKEISIFFSDIRGFTTISENIGSPDILVNFLNKYMTPMTDIIVKNKGTVDKFIGDAIMAYWNAPRDLKNHPDYAIKASIEQIQSLKDLNKELEKENLPSINIGIGLNTGECIVGEMGSSGRSDYTCIGDSVNLASRLESLNKQYGTNIIISEFFLAKLINPDLYDIEYLDDVKVKGKEQSVKIYSCKGYAQKA